MEERRKNRYHSLLRLLDSIIPEEYDMFPVLSRFFTRKDLFSKTFRDICAMLENKNLLSPNNLSILKELFPTRRSITAWSQIDQAERDIEDITDG